MGSKLILNIPHASTWITGVHCIPAVHIAAAYGAFIKMLYKELLPMTDWYTDELFINGVGIPVVAPVSRIICDTERFRNDKDEPMAKIGFGVCYSKTHDLNHNIYWKEGHHDWVLHNLYDIHHRNLELAVDRAIDEFGRALILDCHSFSPDPLPYEPDQTPKRPDICIGTDSFHTPTELVEMTEEFFKSRGYSVLVNSPYSGTMVPLKHLNSKKTVASIMLEINRNLYLKSGTKEKTDEFLQVKKLIADYENVILRFKDYRLDSPETEKDVIGKT